MKSLFFLILFLPSMVCGQKNTVKGNFSFSLSDSEQISSKLLLDIFTIDSGNHASLKKSEGAYDIFINEYLEIKGGGFFNDDSKLQYFGILNHKDPKNIFKADVSAVIISEEKRIFIIYTIEFIGYNPNFLKKFLLKRKINGILKDCLKRIKEKLKKRGTKP